MKMEGAKMAASALALSMAAAVLTGCGNDGQSATESGYKQMDAESREKIAEIAEQDGLLEGELENKTIKWMSTWDINPDASGKNVPVELALFEEVYGGKVEFIKVSWEERFDALANAINADEGVDFFPTSDLDAFPKGAIRGMFAPVDDYIDYDSPLWKDVKDINDLLMWDGQHYVLLNALAGDLCAVIYNRTTVEEAGLTDPAELYAKGEWNWNTFQDMLLQFCDPAKGHYGIDGYWFESALLATCGVPAVGLQDGKLVNNLKDPNLERAENWLYDLNKTGCVAIGVGDYGWEEKPNYIGEGKTLFYPCGLWALYSSADQWQKKFGEDCFFVPMPKDPESEQYCIASGLDGYLMVKGGHNPEGVVKLAECKRFSRLNGEIDAMAKQQTRDDYGWTEEMVQMRESMHTLAQENPYLDFSMAVSEDVKTILDSGENGLRAASRGVPWGETLAAIYDQVDAYIQDANSNPAGTTTQSGT